MECILKHKPNLRKKTVFLKPSKLLPHWHQVPKWIKSLKGQYSENSSPKCAFLIKRVETYALIQTKTKFGGSQIILRIKDCEEIFNK